MDVPKSGMKQKQPWSVPSTSFGPPQNSGSSLLKENPHQVNQSVYELHRPAGVATMQVVFFHGLPFGDVSGVHLSTWETEDGSCYWPKTWLGEDFPDAQIVVVSYNECLEMDAAGSFAMYNVGENLTSDLIDANIGQKSYCPVILVAHSFGGLVIKQLCMQAQKMLISKSDGAKAQKFLDNIKGIFYYSTPHRGSPHIDRAIKVLNHSPLIEYFRILSNEAAQLSHDFNRLCGNYPKWQIKGVGESLPVKSGMFRGVVVVPEASAREGDNFNLDERADHFNICKPNNKTSRRFKALNELLHSIADSSKEEMKSRDKKGLEDARPENWQRLPEQMKGLDFRLDPIKAKLKDCKMLGIVGMGGLGKTTLAKVVFNEFGSAFEYTCFVRDVKLIVGTERKLKKAVWKDMHCGGKKAAEKEEWSKLRGKKLLLVLDDIETDRELQVLLDIVHDTFGESRFIVTSRDHHLLKGLDYVYEVPELDGNNSRQLFISHCFPNEMIPPVKLASHMEAIVEKCCGLPLTLEVVGKYLKLIDDEKYWKQTLEALDKAEVVGDLNEKVWAMLRPSYDGLGENERQMFLDVGTFFGNPHTTWKLRDALVAWSKAYETTTSRLLWQTLVSRSLIYNVKEDENIQMHEQLKNLARRIASESSNNDMCRVWEREKAQSLLQASNELHNKEYHAFQLISTSWKDKVVNVASSALHKLKKVQFLELHEDIIDETVANEAILNRLVLLKCVGVKVFDLARQSPLVVLHVNLRHGMLPNFVGQLSALTVLTLSNVHQNTMPNDIGNLSKLEHLTLINWRLLQDLPKTFGKLVNLKSLTFSDCTELNALPEAFGNLSSLQHLNLYKCQKIEALPKSFGNLLALQHFHLYHCEKLEALPESFGNLSALQHLDLNYCEKLEALPQSFGNLSALRHLDLRSCRKLEALSKSFGNLSTLQHLDLKFCEKFEALPKSFGNLSALQHLDLDYCEKLEALPQSFGNLSALQHLDLGSCRKLEALPTSFGNLSALQHLDLNFCEKLKALPESFGNLSSLQYLNLYQCVKLKAFSKTFGNLPALQHLDLKVCQNLEALPESFGNLSSLQDLNLYKCDKLEALPKTFGNLLALQHLNLASCSKLKALPESFGNLSALQHLDLHYCHKLEALCKSFGNLSALQYLDLKGCEKLEALPKSFGNLSTLQHLDLRFYRKLEALPKSFGNLSTLQHLDLQFCRKLEALPKSFENLLALQHLDLYQCEELEALPESFGNLPTLQHLDLGLCRKLEALPKSFGNLSALQYLDVSGCEELEALPESFGNLLALGCFIVDCVPMEGIPDYIKSMQSMHTLQLGRLPFISELPSWLGDTGAAPLALSYKTFRVQDGHFTLVAEKELSKLHDAEGVIELVHQRAMKKTRASDYEGALAHLCRFNHLVLDDKFYGAMLKGFLLQERGIVKRFIEDLHGALEDVTAALKVFHGYDLHHFAYNCWKHRGYVNFLRKDLDGAQSDGAMALRVLSKCGCENVISPSLGEESITYMHFTLMNMSKIEEEMNSSHPQVMEKVRVRDFKGALAIWDDLNARFSCCSNMAFFLQERGIIKGLLIDLHGALEDLTAALEIIGEDAYDCLKHRGYVKFLIRDLDGAREDAERCLAIQREEDEKDEDYEYQSLGACPVSFFEFNL